MNIKDHCEQLREKIAQLEAEVRSLIGATGPTGEMFANAVVALRHLEDGRMRLGEVIRHHGGAMGAMSAANLPMPIGSETHPLEKTDEGHVAPPYGQAMVEPMPVSPTPAPAEAQMQPQPLDRPFDVPATNTEAVEHDRLAQPINQEEEAAKARERIDATAAHHSAKPIPHLGEYADSGLEDPEYSDLEQSHDHEMPVAPADDDHHPMTPSQEDKEGDVNA